MKPFDLEKAKAGAPVQTKDGNKARIICFDKVGTRYPIVALCSSDYDDCERVLTYTTKGELVSDEINDSADLVMAPVKHEGWINLYQSNNKINSGCLYSTEDEAKNCAYFDNYIATVKIEWYDLTTSKQRDFESSWKLCRELS